MKKLIISVVSALVIIIVAYSAGIGYYAEKFQANTTFGSVDISNLTLPEAEEKFKRISTAKLSKLLRTAKKLVRFN